MLIPNREIVFTQLLEVEKDMKVSERGSVSLVRHKNTRKRFVYRVFSGDGAVYKRMCTLDCPFLPKIYGIHECNGRVHVLEEYVQGDTLAFLLEGNCLTTDHAKQIMLQLCQALQALHGIGAVHRDIKPENIMIRGDQAVLIDFDASRLCKPQNTTDTQVMGTTGYAAPEQYGFSQTDARSDIYALGILLNEMLTKSHPSRKLAEGSLRHVVEKCIQVNADQRYASVDELMRAVRVSHDSIPNVLKRFLIPAICLLVFIMGYSARSLIQQSPISRVPADIRITQYMDETMVLQDSVWTSPVDGCATPFQGDFDGDGKMERYLFGIDFVDSPHENVVYSDINTNQYGSIMYREIHPCIWRVNDDGSMEPAEDLALYLTDTKTSVWRTSPSQSSDLEIMSTHQTWPGSVMITFYDKDGGTWLYEIHTYLGEVPLYAQAYTLIQFSK